MAHMDNYPMNSTDAHYAQRHPPSWPPHLLPPNHTHSTQAPFPSPPASSISEHGQHYPPFYQPGQPQRSDGGGTGEQMNHINRNTSSLSLNLSSLTVTSPTNLSPINAPPSAASAALSPVTPISPSTNPFNHHQQPQHHHNIQSQFQFSPPDPAPPQQQHSPSHYDDQHVAVAPPGSSSSTYDNRRTPGPSRSSSSSTSSTSHLPRKRSFTSNASPSSALVEETMYDEQRDTAMELGASGPAAAYADEMEMRGAYAGNGGGASPIDGSGSTSGGEDTLSGSAGGAHTPAMGMGMGLSGPGGVGGSMNVLGKPMATNNFVTKLYQMINDSKSTHFIAWTELGTSFVVSNVGEFSRSILGSHFKHNNFSSFVRQLNMYGFHKINRTPRAQRTSTDAQTWEFSHHKFLRGRPDLLDEIKRKALEPDPALKHRVELPGEVAAQLGAMRDENRRVWEQLTAERRRVDRLVGVVGRLWDVVGKGFPGSVAPFPSDLLDENPNIYITSPNAGTSRYPPPLSMNMSSQSSLHSMHSLSSPNSSPTASDFPSHIHGQHHHPHPHTLSRQHSFQHVSSTPLPPSPGSINMDLFDENGNGCDVPRGGVKRQRMSNDDDGGMNGTNGSVDSLSSMSSLSSPGTGTGPGIGPGKKLSRARSDSAPLGYSFGAWNQGGISGRPRSGSGLGPRGIPNIGSMSRASNGAPLLSISTVASSNR